MALPAPPESPGLDRGLRRSLLIDISGPLLAEEQVDGPFLAFPGGTFSVAARSFTPSAAVSGATMLRIEVDDAWLVYAPAGAGAITFPAVAALAPLVRADSDVVVQAVQAMPPYAELWTLGSENALDAGLTVVRALSLTDCRHNASAHCRIQ